MNPPSTGTMPRTNSLSYSPERITGYHIDELAVAFDRVRNVHDWSASILAVIPTVERPVVEQAVLWFTGAPPVFVPVPGVEDQLVVRAPGAVSLWFARRGASRR